jgi:hypothetical protein
MLTRPFPVLPCSTAPKCSVCLIGEPLVWEMASTFILTYTRLASRQSAVGSAGERIHSEPVADASGPTRISHAHVADAVVT